MQYALRAFCIVCLGVSLPEWCEPCEVRLVAAPPEIVRQADVILRVRADAYSKKDVSDPFAMGTIKMLVAEVLKGSVAGKTIHVKGYISDYGGPNDQPPPYARPRSR